ncbi:TIGR02328 family protein [Fundicoccus sp. Sow4_H7]|uniref:TIGR02328 family protein n=1 Tax=Fundicoccus sp. Sow4_H7 TaxID=3438784 RepID=UPI003F91A09C
MRLWHEELISLLPRNQLLGQHRECCALRGNGWGRKHETVNYVFKYSPYYLYKYHLLVMNEMTKRGYKISKEWKDKDYRGKTAIRYNDLKEEVTGNPMYKEHDKKYMDECIQNLLSKGIHFKI